MSMSWEEYLEVVQAAAEDYIDENGSEYDDFDILLVDLEESDSVTGAASESYTNDREAARENIADVIYDERFLDMLEEFGYNGVPFELGDEMVDVLVRQTCLHAVADDLEQYFQASQ